MASPTSCGRGRRVSRRFLPATRSVPSCQSISPHFSAATSPARSPKRARSKSTARSRVPMGVARSQLARTCSTVSEGRYLGRDAKRQCALGNGNEKTEKDPHGLDEGFGLTDPTTPGAFEAKAPEGFGLKIFGLLTE